MIDIVTHTLHSEGLLSDCSNISVNIISGRSINVQVFSGQRDQFWNVKVARMSLEREYRALCRAASIFPDAVPTPIALRKHDGLDLLVTRGIAVQAVRRLSSDLIAFLKYYLEAATTGFREAEAVSHRRFLSDMCGTGCLDGWSAELGSWLASRHSGFIDRLPHVAQHGDFCPINLGVSHRRYIIFDWEDFGRVSLPGFDVVIWVMSLLELKVDAVKNAIGRDGAEPASRLLSFIKDLFHVGDTEFRDLIKLYAMVFLHLKQSLNYGAPIISQTSKLLAGLPALSGERRDSRIGREAV